MTTWTEERIDRLRQLWAEGWSGTAISRRLHLSKNACIGKARRLGLEPRPSPIKRARPLTLAEARAMGKRMPEDRPRERESLRLGCPAPDGPCEPEQSAERPCQWPIGEPADPDFRFCGREARQGKPYCAKHCEKAYAGKPPADKAA